MLPQHGQMANNHNAPPLSFQFNDHRSHPANHIQIRFAAYSGIAVVQLVCGALGELLWVSLLKCKKKENSVVSMCNWNITLQCVDSTIIHVPYRVISRQRQQKRNVP